MLLLALRSPAPQPEAPPGFDDRLGSILVPRRSRRVDAYVRQDVQPGRRTPDNLRPEIRGSNRPRRACVVGARNNSHRAVRALGCGEPRSSSDRRTALWAGPWLRLRRNIVRSGRQGRAVAAPRTRRRLAAFFLKRDYFDYFGPHGARAYVSAYTGDSATIDLEYSSERWSSRHAREVVALFRERRGLANQSEDQRRHMHVHVADLTSASIPETRSSDRSQGGSWMCATSTELATSRLKQRFWNLREPEWSEAARVRPGVLRSPEI